MPMSKYDRFYIAEMVKKYPKQPDIEYVFEQVRSFDSATFLKQFEGIINVKNRAGLEAL